MNRRELLAAGALASTLAASGCGAARRDITGGFSGVSSQRGHLLRAPAGTAFPATGAVRRTHTLIAGGGIAGLAAARALRQRGIDDFALLELEDQAGGNSRGATLAGMACPLGAHYLPVPGDDAREVQDLLEEFGLRRRVAGRWRYDERTLCHSPQERLFFRGAWHDGLLPVQGVDAGTLAQYRRFASAVGQLRRQARFTLPAMRASLSPLHLMLDAQTFDAWLTNQGLTDPHLRWYLDYCCRDDFGAGIRSVSAWAGIHYFASRHGFHAPGDDHDDPRDDESDGVLTWPEGNAWITQRLAAPLGERLHTARVVLSIDAGRETVEVEALNLATQQTERWQAVQCIVALPVFIAARVVRNPPDFLREAAARIRHAPWLVANIALDAPLFDRPGAAPSWDNVIYGSPGLGYVDAMHQSLRPVPGATVLTYYRALGDLPDGRAQLLSRPWTYWRDLILTELGVPHPDLGAKATRIDVTRHGHAMAVPTPGIMSFLSGIPPSDGRGKLSFLKRKSRFPVPRSGRLSFAHGDWAGYSVFEEAFTRGHVAGSQAALG